MMRTIQMTIDEVLLGSVDSLTEKLGTSCSAFIREALAASLKAHRIRELEARDREGYQRFPQTADESPGTDFTAWPEW